MKICLSLLLFLVHNLVVGQFRPPGMRDMTFYKNLEDALEEGMPWLRDIGELKSSTNLVQQNTNIIKEALKWRPNGGYLIRVRSGQSLIGGAKVAMPPEFMGVGSLPSDILTLGLSQPSVSSATDPNFLYDPDKTVYLWVSTEKGFLGKERLTYGYIIDGFANQVTNDALKKMADNDLMTNITIAQRGEILEGISQSLEKNIRDKEKALRYIQHIDTYRSNQQKLDKMNADLTNDLKKIGQANQTLSMLSTMKNILSMASLTAQVSASLADSESIKAGSAKTPEELTQIVETYRTNIAGRISQGSTSITILENTVTNERKILVDELHEIGVPQNVLNKLKY